jgi:hypothetical protein
VSLKQRNGWYYLVVKPFPDEGSAKAQIAKVYAGLMWVLLLRGLSPEASLRPQHISQRKFGGAPAPVAQNDELEDDGLIDASSPAVFRSDKSIRVVIADHLTLTQSFNPRETLGLLCEAMTFPEAEGVWCDRKLRIALELYNAFFREASENARFLTLVMALEALAPEERRPVQVSQLIEGWMATVRERRDALPSDSEEWAHYDSLEREIGFRRDVSIRKRIRTLVQSTLAADGQPDADETAKTAVTMYDKRGRLVHDGYLPEQELRDATTQLRQIVGRVLEVRFVQVAGRRDHP